MWTDGGNHLKFARGRNYNLRFPISSYYIYKHYDNIYRVINIACKPCYSMFFV